MTRPTPTRRPNPSEEGYILIWVIFLLVVFAIAMSVAAPRVARDIQLDRERETMERGKQYTRAVQLYYRKFHAFPPNADALVKTTEIRFLRKKYIDPMTGKDDWKPIQFGQAKTQTLGFFGQPVAGAGSAGGSVLAGTGPSGGPPSAFSPPTSTTPPGSTTGTTGTTGSDPTSSGQTFGGAGIIGFEPASPKSSILIYKKKTHYNEWEFIYDPLSDMKTISGNSGLNPTQGTPPTPPKPPPPSP